MPGRNTIPAELRTGISQAKHELVLRRQIDLEERNPRSSFPLSQVTRRPKALDSEKLYITSSQPMIGSSEAKPKGTWPRASRNNFPGPR